MRARVPWGRRGEVPVVSKLFKVDGASGILATGPLKEEVSDMVALFQVDGASGILATGPLKEDVYMVGLFQVDGASGIPAAGPSLQVCKTSPGAPKITLPGLSRSTSPAKGTPEHLGARALQEHFPSQGNSKINILVPCSKHSFFLLLSY